MKKSFLAFLFCLISLPAFCKGLYGYDVICFGHDFSFANKVLYDSGFYPRTLSPYENITSIEYVSNYKKDFLNEDIYSIDISYNKYGTIVSINIIYRFNNKEKTSELLHNLLTEYDHLTQTSANISDDDILEIFFQDSRTFHKLKYTAMSKDNITVVSVLMLDMSL